MLIKRGKIWHYQIKLNDKTWRRSTGQTNKRLAEREAERLEAQVQWRKKRHGDLLTFSQAATREVDRLEGDVSHSTAVRALNSFTAFAKRLGRDVELPEITKEVLEDFQCHRLKRVCLRCGAPPNGGQTTCTKCQRPIGSRVALSTITYDLNFIVRLLDRNGIIVKRPLTKPGRVRETRPFSHDELVRFFNHCTDPFRPLYAMLLCTGIRLAELALSPRSTHTPLLKTEIDFENGLIQIRQAKCRSGKRAKARPLIPVPYDLLTLLRWQFLQTPRNYPLVFSRQHNPSREFQATLRRAGIPVRDAAGRHLWIHSFRHSYCTLLSGQIGNAWQLKEILGHAKLVTTERYTHVEVQVVPVTAINLLCSQSRGHTHQQTAQIEPVPQAGSN